MTAKSILTSRLRRSLCLQACCQPLQRTTARTKGWRLLAMLIVAVLADVGLWPHGAFAVTAFSGSLTSASPTMMGQTNRAGNPNGCSGLKAYPGEAGTTLAYRYTTTTYTNSGPTRCVTFKVTGGSCNTAAFVSVYTAAFNPASKATNYLGDMGFSGIGTYMSVNLQAGQTVTLVVNSTESPSTDCTFTVDTVALTATHDFDGSGKSDILWRQTGGNVAAWLMNGTQISQSGSLGSVPTNWQIVGQADFNGDGKHDLLWRDANTGTLAIWLLNGLQISQTGNLGAVPSNWTVAGTADFNGDGKRDILWRDSSSGAVAVWLMNGTQILQAFSLGTVPSNWVIAGAGDFYGDSKGGILWRDSSSGTVAIWLLNGAQVWKTVSFGTVPANWVIAGIGDFFGWGQNDILWRDSSSGTVAIWLLVGTQIGGTASPGTVSSSWAIAETGDFNGDGKSDILWRHSSGQTVVWFMDGFQAAGTAGLGVVGTDWTVQGLNAD